MNSDAPEPETRPAPPERNPSEPNFDRVARLYRWAEYAALGPLLQRTRDQFLPQICSAQRALLLGDGDGRFTAALLQRAPAVHVHAVDISVAMLNLLRSRCARIGAALRLTTQQVSAVVVHPPPGTDLVVTHFVLDCFSQTGVQAIAHRLSCHLSPGALWVVSDFGLPRSRWIRPFAAAFIRLLYLAFRLLTGLRPQHLPNPQLALQSAGFTRLRRVERLGGLLYSELWQLRVPAPLNAPL